jgi:hypothetical protein
VARVLGRNFPLVLLIVIIGALFWPPEQLDRTEEDGEGMRKPNGTEDMPSTLRH